MLQGRFESGVLVLVDISHDRHRAADAAFPSWISDAGKGTLVRGDRSLGRETFVGTRGKRAVVGTTLQEVIHDLGQGDGATVSPVAVSHLLGTGFVPLPHTAFDAISRIGAGDEAQVSFDEGEPTIVVNTDYPWMTANSRQDAEPSTDRLYELIMSSLQRQLDACGRQGLLMLSSGKDSVTLAIALADLGYDVPCVTYRASRDNNEPEHAAAFCRKLGLEHETVEMPADPAAVRRQLTAFFESAVAPCADHAVIPYIVTVAASGVASGGIIDGGGNDGYMGYIPSQRRRKKRAFRIRGQRMQELAARMTKIDSRVNYLARSRSAAAWPGRNMRFHEIAPIYPMAVDPADKWRETDRELAGMPDIDRAIANMIRQIEGARTPDKVRLVAQTLGIDALLPYCDPALADYFFHLPLAARYDERSRTDKILLRQLLRERIGYESELVGERFFEFDGAPFFIANAEFVRDEIYSCELWEPAVRPLVDGWLEALPQRPFLFHALMSLFMTSGWHNHSPYVVR
jgi:hypothetical protein